MRLAKVDQVDGAPHSFGEFVDQLDAGMRGKRHGGAHGKVKVAVRTLSSGSQRAEQHGHGHGGVAFQDCGNGGQDLGIRSMLAWRLCSVGVHTCSAITKPSAMQATVGPASCQGYWPLPSRAVRSNPAPTPLSCLCGDFVLQRLEGIQNADECPAEEGDGIFHARRTLIERGAGNGRSRMPCFVADIRSALWSSVPRRCAPFHPADESHSPTVDRPSTTIYTDRSFRPFWRSAPEPTIERFFHARALQDRPIGTYHTGLYPLSSRRTPL